MTTILRALTFGLLGCVLAASPPAPAKFLLLDTRQLLEGEIERVGDGYRVRRDGGETHIPAARVVLVGTDRAEAYRYLSASTDANNADERIKLATWCQTSGLPQQAIQEARAAVELRPKHAASIRLLKYCEESAAKPAAPAAARPAPPAPLPDSVDCSPQSLQHFHTRVQPVLMNACAQCHNANQPFALQRVFSDAHRGRAATFQNLSASLNQIDKQKPAASPLLVKALSAHGGAVAPPLRDRGTPAYQHLDMWVRMVAGDTGATPIAPPAETPTTGTSSFAGSRAEDKPAGPKDPFDPIDFNKPLPPPPKQ